MDSNLVEFAPTMPYSQEYTDALFVLCERFYIVGRFDEAETLAFELRYLCPQDVRVYKLSAAIQAATGNFLFAYNCYSNGLRVAQDDPELWVGMGQAAIHLDQFKEAMKCLDMTISLSTKDEQLSDHARRLRNLIQ